MNDVRVGYTCQKVSPVEEEPVSAQDDIPDSVAIELYRKMVLSRTLDERLRTAYENLEFRGELHLSMGHEAVAVGAVAAAEPCFVSSHYRSHALAVAKGLDLKAVAAEIYGRATGVCKGKGGHMHLTDLSRGFAATSIVGASVPIGAGYAFASKLLGRGTPTLAFMGDGALHQGGVMETFNIASIWGLPLLLVVENNEFAFSTPSSTHSSVQPLAARARGFNIASYTMDGIDANAVYAFASTVVKDVMSGSRPILVEFKVPRLSGHVEVVDFEDYRSAKEKAKLVERDPIAVTRATLLSQGVLDESKDEQLRKEAAKQVQEALEYAASSPFPPADEAYSGVG
ncbi:MAG: thiamine pyrophosphate-dependent dehydrogenase E1 component subunit alpha [Nitrososphaerales archaeon]|nr:thiamine pyrophosphate-dependent dehydrogenase E1 component subunit alpha [Nitrososphaerales archaeon]